jgi:hypothetical protein
LNGTRQLLVCADVSTSVDENIHISEKNFHARSQQIGLEGNSEKTEYMSMHQEQKQDDFTA